MHHWWQQMDKYNDYIQTLPLPVIDLINSPTPNSHQASLANCGRKFCWIVSVTTELAAIIGFGKHTSGWDAQTNMFW